MSAKINVAIPTSVADTVGENIKSILELELPNQVTLSESPELTTTVNYERIPPFDNSEIPLINIHLSESDYQRRSSKSGTFDAHYYIDIIFSAKATGSDLGSTVSKSQTKIIANWIRTILLSPVYRHLNFSQGVIARFQITNLKMIVTDSEKDAEGISVGRLTIEVHGADDYILQSGEVATSVENVVKLDETEKGHLFENVPEV